MSFDTNRWSCYRWRHAVNSAKNFLGKIFLIIWVFIGETRLPLYPSWCQITHLTKTETEPQMEQFNNPSLGFEPQTGIIDYPSKKVNFRGLKSGNWFQFFSGLTKHVENVFFAKKKASHLVKSCLGNTIYNLHPNMSFPFYAIFTTQISKKYSIVLCEYDWHSWPKR